MALKMRMARAGRKKSPFYRIVVADARAPRDGNFIAKVGTYNPLLNKENDQRVILDLDLCKKWLAEGAQPSERVARFLADAGLIAAPEQTNRPNKSAPKAKAQERILDKEKKVQAAKDAEEAAKAKAEADKAEAAAAAEAAKNAPAVEEEAPAEEAAAPAEEETKTE